MMWPSTPILRAFVATAATFKVEMARLMSKERTQEAAIARHVAMWVARRHTTASLTQIGKVCGRDHTTVLHGINRVEKMRSEDLDFRIMVDDVERRLVRALAQKRGAVKE